MPDDHYDVVVIGAGIAGLSCAAHLAQAGKKVLVLEQHSRPGGCWTSFTREGIIFDIGSHWTVDAGRLNDMLDDLNGQSLPFVPMERISRLLGPVPGSDIQLSKYREKFERSILSSFPTAKKKAVDTLIEESLEVERQLQMMPPPTNELSSSGEQLKNRLGMNKVPKLVKKYSSISSADWLASLFPGKDLEGLRTSLTMIVPVPGVPAIGIMSMIATALTGRAYSPVGGAQHVAAAFEEAVLRHGGEIQYSRKVCALALKKRKVTGVVLEDGQEIQAGAVVAASDATALYQQMVPQKLVPRGYKKRLNSPVSAPYVLVSIVTDINPADFGFSGNEVAVLSSAAPREIYAPNEPEKGNYRVVLPQYRTADSDPNLYGLQIISNASFDFQKNWKAGDNLERTEEYQAFKHEYAMRLVGQLEKHIPNLSDHIVNLDIATPLTLCRYTLNDHGAARGWAKFQPWKHRVPFLKGLYQAGHWVAPAGVYSVAYSGKLAAQLVLNDHRKKNK